MPFPYLLIFQLLPFPVAWTNVQLLLFTEAPVKDRQHFCFQFWAVAGSDYPVAVLAYLLSSVSDLRSRLVAFRRHY